MEEKLENKIEPKELWRVFGIFIAVIFFFFLVILFLVFRKKYGFCLFFLHLSKTFL